MPSQLNKTNPTNPAVTTATQSANPTNPTTPSPASTPTNSPIPTNPPIPANPAAIISQATVTTAAPNAAPNPAATPTSFPTPINPTNPAAATQPANPANPAATATSFSPSLIQQYQSFLKADKKLSASSIKNYLSDTNHFLVWLSTLLKLSNLKPQHITSQNIKTYQQALTKVTPPIPQNTLNRRLSSLRRFCSFLQLTGLSKTNPAQSLDNVYLEPTLSQTLATYAKFLKTEKLSHSTIKNYLSDIKSYLLWAQKNIKTTESDQDRRSLN